MFDPTVRCEPEARRPRWRRRVERGPIHIESDLVGDHPITAAELDAIEQLLGRDLQVLLTEMATHRS
jgi:hypothetical protein